MALDDGLCSGNARLKDKDRDVSILIEGELCASSQVKQPGLITCCNLVNELYSLEIVHQANMGIYM